MHNGAFDGANSDTELQPARAAALNRWLAHLPPRTIVGAAAQVGDRAGYAVRRSPIDKPIRPP
jgi:hypothetical protein